MRAERMRCVVVVEKGVEVLTSQCLIEGELEMRVDGQNRTKRNGGK